MCWGKTHKISRHESLLPGDISKWRFHNWITFSKKQSHIMSPLLLKIPQNKNNKKKELWGLDNNSLFFLLAFFLTHFRVPHNKLGIGILGFECHQLLESRRLDPHHAFTFETHLLLLLVSLSLQKENAEGVRALREAKNPLHEAKNPAKWPMGTHGIHVWLAVRHSPLFCNHWLESPTLTKDFPTQKYGEN